MHCSTLFLVGSQFIFKNSFVPMRALLSRFKQYLMHLFWAICILFDCRVQVFVKQDGDVYLMFDTSP